MAKDKIIKNIETSVVIAGAGPVGMVLALELARRGVDCVLLNDKPTTATHPKANAISSRTMEHLRRLGISEAVRARGLDDDHPTDVSYFTRLTGHAIGRYRQPSRAESLALAASGEGAWASPEPPHRCSQLYLEEEIKRAVDAESTIDVRFGWRLESFEDHGRHVTAVAQESAGKSVIELRADYLVGCDGAGSMVRRRLGVELEGESGVVRPMMGGPMYAAYFETEEKPDWLPNERAWQYWCINKDVRTCMVHIDSDRQFVILFAVPDEDKRKDVDPRPYIYRAVGREFPIKVHSTLNWTAGFALVAQSFFKNRVFLAGDAAHLFTPTGGMGMNTGVDDAVNLGWKMAAVLQGRGGPALLESYETERRAIGHRNVRMASRFADSVGAVDIT
ncbi:MAG: FAD-dependent monooxygenase, partial [Proteobacteria bacterium]|nr:FAD-dependent monooxygenase [Pseudomonadota bacterium]